MVVFADLLVFSVDYIYVDWLEFGIFWEAMNGETEIFCEGFVFEEGKVYILIRLSFRLVYYK